MKKRQYYFNSMIGPILRDIPHEDTDIIVRSGDYLSLLASRLDAISSGLKDNTYAIDIEHYVRELMYINTKYELKAKRTTHEDTDN